VKEVLLHRLGLLLGYLPQKKLLKRPGIQTEGRVPHD